MATSRGTLGESTGAAMHAPVPPNLRSDRFEVAGLQTGRGAAEYVVHVTAGGFHTLVAMSTGALWA